MMRKLLKTDLDLALLIVRIALGVGFMMHGLQKLQGIEGVVGFFGSMGLPAFMAYVVALIETLGGAAMILGVCTEAAGLLLAAVMIGALTMVKIKAFGAAADLYSGYFKLEIDVAYLAMALAIAFAGPGKYAVKWCLPKEEKKA